jgi:hypothetical protein
LLPTAAGEQARVGPAVALSLLGDRHVVRSQLWPFWFVWIAPGFVFLWLTDSTEPGQDPYRFMMYYLPEYRVLQLDPLAHSTLAARGARQGTWRPAGDAFRVITVSDKLRRDQADSA